jgi:galactonate dehydratase
MLDTSLRLDNAVRRMAEIREAFGFHVKFGLDFHGRVARPMAKTLIRELEPYRPLFIDESVLATHADDYATLAETTSIPLVAGERMYSRYGFKPVCERTGFEN